MNPRAPSTEITGDSFAFLYSDYLNPTYLFDRGYAFFRDVLPVVFSSDTLNLFYTLCAIFSIFFLTLISYCLVRLFEIRHKEEEHVEHEIAEYAHHMRELQKKKEEGGAISQNPRWVQTLTYLHSDNPGDWKLAIIEADSMLEGLLDQMGFKGQGLGEKLRFASQDTFRGLSSAWEAHAIRNRIAHEGISYDISHFEAKRTIALYEGVFREYGYI